MKTRLLKKLRKLAFNRYCLQIGLSGLYQVVYRDMPRVVISEAAQYYNAKRDLMKIRREYIIGKINEKRYHEFNKKLKEL